MIMKEKTKIFDATGVELINLLEGNCDGIVNETYPVQLTLEEEDALKNRVVDLSAQRQIIEERKTVVMKEFKDELKPINEELEEDILILRRGSNIRTGKLYKFIEDHMVSHYDQNGQFIYSRPLREEEKQLVIKESLKAQNE